MNTSAQIKQFLQQHQPTGVDQISRALDLTKADIHYHIRQLLDRGEIAIETQKRRSNSPGRPARLYHLVESVPITTTRLILSVLLLETMGNPPAVDRTQAVANGIASAILSSCQSYSDVIISPSIRLNRIINELTPFGLHLSWEAGKRGPDIRINKEPFSALFNDSVFVYSILESLIFLLLNEIA